MANVNSKSVLAKNYGVTVRTMMTWIHRNPKCRRELKELGWNPNSKIMKPSEVEVLIKYFGE